MIHRHIINQYKIIPTGVIHIGAHIGEEIEHYIDMQVENLIYIEANPEVMDALQRNIKKYKDKINVNTYNIAITNKRGVFDFYVTNNFMSSSLFHLKEHLKYYPDIYEARTIKVNAITFDDFMVENQIDKYYNILIMDTQGAELSILESSLNYLSNFDMIISEISRIEIFENGCKFTDLTKFLEEHNYVLIDYFENRDKPNDDAIYINRRIIDASR